MDGTRQTVKHVYRFGGGKAEGNESMKNLLGGKGANLAEMAGHPDLRLPVPPGFTVTTEVCTYLSQNGRKYPKTLNDEVKAAIREMEKICGKKFGDEQDPLLVSVRSGARRSMPGMMETVLNIGLNDRTIEGLTAQSGDERFAYDAYRRLIMMYADVVMEKGAGIEPKGKGIRKMLDELLEDVKRERGYASDTDLTADDLKALVVEFKKIIKEVLGKAFPEVACSSSRLFFSASTLGTSSFLLTSSFARSTSCSACAMAVSSCERVIDCVARERSIWPFRSLTSMRRLNASRCCSCGSSSSSTWPFVTVVPPGMRLMSVIWPKSRPASRGTRMPDDISASTVPVRRTRGAAVGDAACCAGRAAVQARITATARTRWNIGVQLTLDTVGPTSAIRVCGCLGIRRR
jgi:hypothetical protein